MNRNHIDKKVMVWVKWVLPFYLFTFLPLQVSAQVKFGYLSFQQVLRTMPEYEIAQRNLADLRNQYDAEMKRAEEEFNSKYEEFLEGQKDFAVPIRQKRQAELQELMEKNLAFKQEAQRLLDGAERDAYLPLKNKLKTVIARVGQERGYAFVLNTDNDACPYIDSVMGEDITEAVKRLLK